MQNLKCDLFLAVTDQVIVEGVQETYEQAFGRCRTTCIQDQSCYSRESLAAALADPDYLKFILRDGDRVTAFVLATSNLDKARVTFVNPQRLEALYPDEVKAGKLWYFTAIAVRPECQGLGYTAPLFDLITDNALKERAGIVFDFSVEKNAALPQLLIRASARAMKKFGYPNPDPKYQSLGGQEYGILRLL